MKWLQSEAVREHGNITRFNYFLRLDCVKVSLRISSWIVF